MRYQQSRWKACAQSSSSPVQLVYCERDLTIRLQNDADRSRGRTLPCRVSRSTRRVQVGATTTRSSPRPVHSRTATASWVLGIGLSHVLRWTTLTVGDVAIGHLVRTAVNRNFRRKFELFSFCSSVSVPPSSSQHCLIGVPQRMMLTTKLNVIKMSMTVTDYWML